MERSKQVDRFFENLARRSIGEVTNMIVNLIANQANDPLGAPTKRAVYSSLGDVAIEKFEDILSATDDDDTDDDYNWDGGADTDLLARVGLLGANSDGDRDGDGFTPTEDDLPF